MPLFKPSTRFVSWSPTYSPQGGMTYIGVSTPTAIYAVDGELVNVIIRSTGTIGGVLNANLDFSLPFVPSSSLVSSVYVPAYIQANGADGLGYIRLIGGNADARVFPFSPAGNWPAGAGGFTASFSYRKQ